MGKAEQTEDEVCVRPNKPNIGYGQGQTSRRWGMGQPKQTDDWLWVRPIKPKMGYRSAQTNRRWVMGQAKQAEDGVYPGRGFVKKNVRLAVNSGEKRNFFTAKRPHRLALSALKAVNFCKNCVEFCGEKFFFTAFTGILAKKKPPYKGSNLNLMRVLNFVIHCAICHLLQ